MALNPSPTVAPGNTALTPVADADRLFGWRDHAALWFSLGVGLLVMQVGAYLTPALGLREALPVIAAGSLLGAGLLAWTARLGTDSGLSSAGLMHATYGRGFARLPVVLNIVQLIGWTTFELVVMRDGTVAIAGRMLGLDAAGSPSPPSLVASVLATLLWGGVLALLLAGSMVRLVRRLVGRIGLPLVVLSLAWLSWQFLGQAQAKGWATLWNTPGQGGMGSLQALDLVIAMPVSWLPLVADFSRHGRSGAGALRGTWLGYALANTWCYALGVLVALAAPSEDLVGALLLAQGGLIALGLILIDEADNAYGDLYAGAVAGHSLRPRWGVRGWGLGLAALSTALAMVLPMHSLEPFLLMLSSVFVPLYGVILGRLGFARGVASSSGPIRPLERFVEPRAAALWLGGIALYHALAQGAPQFGAALPTLAVTLVLAALTRPKA